MSHFDGAFYSGEGDTEYLRLLDIARRMFRPDPQYQNITMLYQPRWNGLVEGPSWGAWWIQNSYGPSFCSLPFLLEPYSTFIRNSQALWFDRMGDGQRTWQFKPYNEDTETDHGIIPDGCLCDVAWPEDAIYKQGDGIVSLHDWPLEFTAAGLLLQAELLLIERDTVAIDRYLPALERCAAFLESRRDPDNDLFLAGPAANLLAPSYAGWKKQDGSYDKAYLCGLSVTYVAALDRLVEVEKLAGRHEQASAHAGRRETARKAIEQFTTEEGYLVKHLDPDGTRHGVYGADEHGYFEATCNHDAVCFRVVDDAQARDIYEKMTSIPGLRPHHLVLANYPSLDDMYVPDEGLFRYGQWVNGGHWSTCEARMIMGYYRLGMHADARKSMEAILTFADRFQMDNPLKEFGTLPWLGDNPTNINYDAFGIPAAMVRGLFEYVYGHDELTLYPHIPPTITRLEQRFPVRWGNRRLFLSTVGTGAVTGVQINGRRWDCFDADSVRLRFEDLPEHASMTITMGTKRCAGAAGQGDDRSGTGPSGPDDPTAALLPLRFADRDLAPLRQGVEYAGKLHRRLCDSGQADSYLAGHARVVLEAAAAIWKRKDMKESGQLKPLPKAAQQAADEYYVKALESLCQGLKKCDTA